MPSKDSTQNATMDEAVIRAPWTGILLLVWIAALILGCIGLYERATGGHLPAGYGSYVPWGLWIGLYFHGVGMAGGAFAVGVLLYLMDRPGFASAAVLRMVIVLAAAAILPAFLGVWFDLGHMERAWRIFVTPSFTSMMSFNAWMYAVFLVVAAVSWFLSFRSDSEWLKPLLCLGGLFSILFPSQSGAFFGVVDARPFWNSALLPMLFLVSAFTSGTALLLVVYVICRREDPQLREVCRSLRVFAVAGLLTYFALEFAEFSIAFWSPVGSHPAMELILWGKYWWVFWLVHLLLGGLVPFALLCTRRLDAWFTAAVLIAICFLSARLNVLIPGQAVGELVGLQEAFTHPRLRHLYQATAMEYRVGFLMLAMGMAVFFVGQRLGLYISRSVQSN